MLFPRKLPSWSSGDGMKELPSELDAISRPTLADFNKVETKQIKRIRFASKRI
jgi:hypothetical protein